MLKDLIYESDLEILYELRFSNLIYKFPLLERKYLTSLTLSWHKIAIKLS